jgi:hypothetical protein
MESGKDWEETPRIDDALKQDQAMLDSKDIGNEVKPRVRPVI